MQRTIGGPQYHLICFSCVWDTKLFEEFEADTCVAIADSSEFSRRVEEAGKVLFPGWYYIDCPVQYFDPYELGRNEYIDSSLSKDFRFAYQNEYRILWSNIEGVPIHGFQFINIGSSHDIMTMYDPLGREISARC